MPPARLVGVLALGVALLAVRPVPAAAQPELQMWLNPEMGKQIPRADYRYTFYPERKVEDQPTHFAMTEQRVTMFTPLYQDSKDEWGFAAKALYQDIDTHARFPKAGGAFPSELWDISAGLSYRHKFDNDWTGGLALTVGSSSDEPFNTFEEMYIHAIAMVRVPSGERNSWIFTLIYASDEEVFGQTLPIPGIAFGWNPSDKFQAVIGFPFSMIRYKPFETLTLDAEYSAPRGAVNHSRRRVPRRGRAGRRLPRPGGRPRAAERRASPRRLGRRSRLAHRDRRPPRRCRPGALARGA